jgi:hypothetical protein
MCQICLLVGRRGASKSADSRLLDTRDFSKFVTRDPAKIKPYSDIKGDRNSRSPSH